MIWRFQCFFSRFRRLGVDLQDFFSDDFDSANVRRNQGRYAGQNFTDFFVSN